MPFTPFHLGPTFLVGMISRQRINLVAILLASIIVDIRAIYCFFTQSYPLHGPLHTYLGASSLCFFLIIGIYISRKYLKNLSKVFNIEEDYSLQSIVLGTILGAWSHVLLDSFLYPEMSPLWPIEGNPFLGLIPSSWIYFFCAISFMIGGLLYVDKHYKRNEFEEKKNG